MGGRNKVPSVRFPPAALSRGSGESEQGPHLIAWPGYPRKLVISHLGLFYYASYVKCCPIPSETIHRWWFETERGTSERFKNEPSLVTSSNDTEIQKNQIDRETGYFFIFIAFFLPFTASLIISPARSLALFKVSSLRCA